MVIVDTCIWSSALRTSREHASDLRDELSRLIVDHRAVIIGPVRQELLSGVRQRARFDQLREHLRSFADEPINTEDYEFAAELHCRCADRGIATSPIDLLICAVALRREWSVFTIDRDFLRYRQVAPLQLHASEQVQ
jgi:predicted nucleic acid-binding protein